MNFKKKASFWPSKSEWNVVFHSLNRREWLLVSFSGVILTGTVLGMLALINVRLSIEVPEVGGSITEGIVGTPRFINPVISISDADNDMTALVYSGLMRKSSEGLIPDLGESYTVSEDGKVYTFILKDNAIFHDGKKVTANDIVYTISLIKDPVVKSTKRASWEGVNVIAVDDKTVEFTLAEPFSGFLENTTLGILPKHIWEDIKPEEISFSDSNVNPIGSGPYKVDKVKKKPSGVPDFYTLESFDRFVLGEPYISKITIKFFANEAELSGAFSKNVVDSAPSLSPLRATSLEDRSVTTETTALPRVFGVFFNHNRVPLFNDPTIISALERAIDKERIVNEVMYGYATSISSPIPPDLIDTLGQVAPSSYNPVEALSILEKKGWKQNPETGVLEKKTDKTTEKLSFSIATSDTEELKEAGAIVKENLEKIGVSVELKVYDIGTLNLTVIRPRDYDALLFGEVVGSSSDLFAFWHSSQRNDPGLNVAMYTNKDVDTLLEKANNVSDTNERIELYKKFENIIIKDKPAIFLYSPSFIYLWNDNIKGIELTNLSDQSERFNDIYKWHMHTDRIWPIFAKN